LTSKNRLRLDEKLPIEGPTPVRVFIFPVEEDISEAEWLRFLTVNPVFDFLKDPAEDIYTLENGKSFCNLHVQ